MERVELALMTFEHGREQLLFTFNNGRRFWLENNGHLEEWDKKKATWNTLHEGDDQTQSLASSPKVNESE